MGSYGDNGYTAGTSGELTDVIRVAIDDGIGTTQDYGSVSVPTIAGGWTLGLGAVASGVEERMGLIVDAIDPRRARGQALSGHAAAVNVTRQAATPSVYLVRGVTTSGTSTLSVGVTLQDDTTDARTWTVRESVTVTTSATQISIECADTGRVELPASVAFTVVTPVVNAPTVTYDSSDGDAFQVGQPRELDPALRIRMGRQRAAVPSPTKDGLRAGLLELTWVTAASVVRTAAHKIAVYVHPAPVDTTQEQEAVDAIGYRVAAGTILAAGTGTTFTQDYTLSDGTTESLTLTVPAAQTVDVAAALTLASGLTLADVRDEVEAVISATFAGLDVGQTLGYSAMYCAIYSVEGVEGVAYTLDGGFASVAPSTSATQLAEGTVTIT